MSSLARLTRRCGGSSGVGSTRLYHSQSYNAAADRRRGQRTSRRPDVVTNSKGIYEYLLGGKKDHTAADDQAVRREDEDASRTSSRRTKAKAAGVSNCPLCAMGDNANKTRIYKPDEMDADHVTAWSKGGATDLEQLRDALRHPQPRQGQQVGSRWAWVDHHLTQQRLWLALIKISTHMTGIGRVVGGRGGPPGAALSKCWAVETSCHAAQWNPIMNG